MWFWYIVIVGGIIYIIYSIYNKIKDYKNDKQKAYKYVYSPDTPKPLIENKIEKTPSFNECSLIVKHINSLYLSANMVKYYDSLIIELKDKINVSKKWKFDNIQELNSRLVTAQTNRDKYSKISNSLLIISDESNYKIESFCNKFPVIKNENINKFFGRCTGYSFGIYYIIFYKHLIIVLKNDYSNITCYRYSDLKLNHRNTYVNKKSINNKDIVISSHWLHSKMNGDRDLRFTNNYIVYNVKKFYMYFDKFEGMGFTLDLQNEVNEYSDLFASINATETSKHKITSTQVQRNEQMAISVNMHSLVEKQPIVSDAVETHKPQNNVCCSNIITTPKIDKPNEIKTEVKNVESYEVIETSPSSNIESKPETIESYSSNGDMILGDEVIKQEDSIESNLAKYDEFEFKGYKYFRLFPKKNEHKYFFHATFGIGVSIVESINSRTVYFLKNVGNKIISKNYPIEEISESSIRSRILSSLFEEKYIRYSKIGKVINGKDDYLIIKYPDSSTDKVYVDFSDDLTYLEFKYEILTEKQYNEIIEIEKHQLENKYAPLIGSYVKSTVYNYGKIIRVSYDKLTILFDNFGEKVISATHSSIKFLSEAVYNSEKQNEVLEKIKYANGDVFMHPVLGICKIIDSENDTYVTVQDIVKTRQIKKSECAKYINENLIERDRLCSSVNVDEYLYSYAHGYCKVMGVSETTIVLMEIVHNQIIKINKNKLNFFEKQNEDISAVLSEIKLFSLFDLADETYYFCGFKDKLLKLANSPSKSITNTINCEISKVQKHYKNKNLLSKCYDIALLELLDRDYYNKKNYREELQEFILEYGNPDDNVINKFYKNSDKIDGIILSSRYSDIENYIRCQMLNSKIYRYESPLESQHYNYVLDKLCKEHFCLKIGNNYITQKCMLENNISELEFDEFNKKLTEYIKKNDFISIAKIKQLFDNKLLAFITDDQSMIDYIRSFTIYKNHLMGKTTVVFLRTKAYKKEYFEKMVMRVLKKENTSSMYVYDIIDKLRDEYLIEYEDNQFINETSNFESLFYSEDTEKVYINKKTYYSEVFK